MYVLKKENFNSTAVALDDSRRIQKKKMESPPSLIRPIDFLRCLLKVWPIEGEILASSLNQPAQTVTRNKQRESLKFTLNFLTSRIT